MYLRVIGSKTERFPQLPDCIGVAARLRVGERKLLVDDGIIGTALLRLFRGDPLPAQAGPDSGRVGRAPSRASRF